MSLSFLSKIQIVEPAAAGRSGGGRRKEWNPTRPNSIRVWKSGAVYPSQDLVERFSLEYGNKPGKGQKATGNAIDVFATEDFPTMKIDESLIIANITSKSAGKADLFDSTTYNEDGTPKVTVMEQGSTTFGKNDLLPMIEKVYGITLGEKTEFVDLVLLGLDGEKAQQPYTIEKGFCFVPKMVSRGEKKGEMTNVRRELPVLFVLYPATMLSPDGSAADLESAADTCEAALEEMVNETTA